MFRIVITETKEVRKVHAKVWTLCGPQESAKYDYAPEVETIGAETSNIYEQIVDELDLLAVIAAVNGSAFTRTKIA